MKKIKLLILISTLLATACSPDSKPKTKRTFVPNLNELLANNETAQKKQPSIPPMDDPWATEGPLACEYINQLSQLSQKSRTSVYSLFKSVRKDKEGLVGRIDIAQSPFTQLYLAEVFKFPTYEEFSREALKEKDQRYWYENLAAQNPENFVGNFLSNITNGSSIRDFGVNEKLNAAFPGIFGDETPLKNSLFLQLARKIGYNEKSLLGLDEMQAQLPLFLPFAELPSDIENSLSSAIRSLNYKNSDPDLTSRERLCSFILWQRTFAQMLAIKGHSKPKIEQSGNFSIIAKLAGQSDFGKQEEPGYFINVKEQKRVVLSPEDIQNYDPKKKLLVVNLTPIGSEHKRGSFEETLNVFDAMVSVYGATSPAARWATENHVVGDPQDVTNKAILPDAAHHLSLGLVTLLFKNIAGLNLKRIDEKGRLFQPSPDDAQNPKKPAGILLGDTVNDKTMVKLREILQFAKSVMKLDYFLGQFGAEAQFRTEKIKKWADMSLYVEKPDLYDPRPAKDIPKIPFYSELCLARLVGTDLIEEKELNKLLTPKEKESILRPLLHQLYLPLVMLANKMANYPQGCASEMIVDLTTGEKKMTSACSDEEKQLYRYTMKELARVTQSPVLLESSKRDL